MRQHNEFFFFSEHRDAHKPKQRKHPSRKMKKKKRSNHRERYWLQHSHYQARSSEKCRCGLKKKKKAYTVQMRVCFPLLCTCDNAPKRVTQSPNLIREEKKKSKKVKKKKNVRACSNLLIFIIYCSFLSLLVGRYLTPWQCSSSNSIPFTHRSVVLHVWDKPCVCELAHSG